MDRLICAQQVHIPKARILACQPLYDSEGKPVAAASGIGAKGEFLVILPDNAYVLACVRWPSGECEIWPLRPGDSLDEIPKRAKPDWEALTWGPKGELLFFGSGSRPTRRHIGVASFNPPQLTLTHLAEAPELYALLQDALGPTVELNIEGVIWRAQERSWWFFQRGHKQAPSALLRCKVPEEVDPITGLFSPPKSALSIAVSWYDLGEVAGVPLAFTDAVEWQGQVFYTATAEDTPNAYEDGPVVGSAIGWIDAQGQPYYTVLQDEQGAPLPLKVEGIAPQEQAEKTFFLVTDSDRAGEPAQLLRAQLVF